MRSINEADIPVGQAEAKPKREFYPPSGFGRRLRQLREKAGINPYELTRVVGASHAVVPLIESGKILSPKVGLALNLAEALGTTTQYLDRGEGQEPTRDQILAAYQLACERKGLR